MLKGSQDKHKNKDVSRPCAVPIILCQTQVITTDRILEGSI